MNTLNFNLSPNYILHLDLNSCFATVEQQANPLLRGKPVAVAAYNSPGGCILAPSIEAKKLGIKTGMRVREGKEICPSLIVLSSDPNKYRFVNRRLLALLQEYSSEVYVRSIDEMVIDFTNSPHKKNNLTNIALEIKKRIRAEIGEWLSVSVGIAPNRFLAKLASSLKKPDGLVTIDHTNIISTLSKIKLEDIHGIKSRNSLRLNLNAIYTPVDFFNANISTLKKAFGGITGYYWYLRMHGFEIDSIEFSRKSYGNSYHLYKFTNNTKELSQILCKLSEKTGRRLRKAGYIAKGVHVSVLLEDYSYYHHGQKTETEIYTNNQIYKQALKILEGRPKGKKVRILAISVFNLKKNLYSQTSLFEDINKKISSNKSY